ncbi:MarR family winged helix-turn-helix transcriptional regulator [Hoeflea poritis]|uniref:MarR family transcriptional regulator n=1 Tax=Hoeflea poritis TaxID=2993659 RepID=A0ABT4VRP1_9HYPH|nr:MarR family transcriptional regulator [Hoeflea poritis]MDA4847375.1 MarR family transcriptional regulator [Hoeflea poritis]
MTKEHDKVGNNRSQSQEDPHPDHIGWDLWRARDRWKQRFVSGMQDRGHGWFTEARANILGQLPRKGLKQSDLAARTGLTKQAVQQFVDGLVDEGILERQHDPSDARARIVRLTAAGRSAMQDADVVKEAVERAFARRYTAEEFTRFRDLLKRIAEDPDE